MQSTVPVSNQPLSLFAKVRAWLRAAPVLDPYERMHAPAVQVLLVALALSVLLVESSAVPLLKQRPLSASLNLLMGVFALACLYLVRLGQLRLAVRLLSSVFMVALLFAYAVGGLERQTGNLVSQLSLLLLAGLVLPRHDFWLMSAAFVAAIGLGSLADIQAGRESHWVGTLMSLVLFSIVLDALSAGLRRSYKLALVKERALKNNEARMREQALEREHLQMMLFQAQKQESLHVLSIAFTHDLNHALASIQHLLEVELEQAQEPQLKERPPEANDSYADPASSIARWQSALAQIKLVAGHNQSLMQLAKNAHQAPLIFDSIAALRALEPLLRHVAGARAKLSMQLKTELAAVSMDRGLFDMVMVNLLSNAHDAVTADGRIEVCAEVAEGRLLISVRDNGCGMDASTLARAGEPFFTTKRKGTGLGLSIVKRVIEGADGVFEMRSEPAVGSEIRFGLPICRSQTPSAAQTAGDHGPSQGVHTRGARRNILVVDDDPDILRIMEAYLRFGGFEVECVGDASSMLQILEAHRQTPYLALVIDERMPNLLGSDAIRTAHQRALLPATVHVSADVLPSEVSTELAGLGVVFLGKPFAKEALLAAVEAALVKRLSEASAQSQAP